MDRVKVVTRVALALSAAWLARIAGAGPFVGSAPAEMWMAVGGMLVLLAFYARTAREGGEELPRGEISSEDRWRVEVITKEVEILQTRFDKYDGAALQQRNWGLAAGAALVGYTVVGDLSRDVVFVAAVPLALAFLSEWLTRSLWIPYVFRYRELRSALWTGRVRDVALMDVTSSIGRGTGGVRVRAASLEGFKLLASTNSMREVISFYCYAHGVVFVLALLVPRLAG